MAMIRTSRSLLMDRAVCVQRRLIREDGVGGTYQDYTVIIPKYWTRIYPDHHQLRIRHELGELPKNATHRAIAEPSTNGKTIKVGDRVYDYKNNLIYDVVEVARPAHKLHYGAMTQFSLIIVQDDSPTYGCDPNGGLAASFGTAAQEIAGAGQGDGGNGAGSSQTHFILRPFEIVDLDNIRAGSVSYGDYDAFVYGHVDTNNDVVQTLVNVSGKRCLTYFEVMCFPPASFHNSWFDWWRTNFQTPGTIIAAGLTNSSSAPGVFRFPPACEDRQFVDWSLLTAGHRLTIAEKMFSYADVRASGLFLDQAWMHESPSFFFSDPGSGGACGSCAYCATYASISPAKWPLWQASMSAFYTLVDQMAADRGLYNLKNGEHRTIGTPPQTPPRPIEYENSATNGLEGADPLTNSINGWREHPQNLLSIDVPDNASLATVLSAFEQYGGWVGFTGASAANADVQSAYAQAASIRAMHLG